METAYLKETTWEKVDQSHDPAAFVTYLDRLGQAPTMQDFRTRFLNRLPYHPGDRILDAGCGIGSDTRLLQQRLGSTGQVVGLDASHHMLQRARAISCENTPPGENTPEFVHGNLTHIPFASASFNGVYCNRVLMHLQDPLTAVRDMLRILKPGGWMVLFEPDWSSARIEPDNYIARALLDTHYQNFKNGDIGRQLTSLAQWAGARVVHAAIHRCALSNYRTVRSMMNLERSLNRAVRSGRLLQQQAETWRTQMVENPDLFQLQITCSVCIARKSRRW